MNPNSSAAQALRIFRPAEHGGWSHADAAHLLGRLTFGVSSAAVAEAVDRGLTATLDRLVPQAGDEPPETADFAATEQVLYRAALSSNDISSLKSWWLYRMRYSNRPLAEKMTLFWHNHFATSQAKVQSVRHMANQHELLRRHALGDFRSLLHGISKDVAMLMWLDSNSNRKRHPNENFARELMELFSLGVGNYTERDIQEAARAFSGWHVRNDEFWFNRLQHDDGSKRIFDQTAAFDGGEVVDLCLDAPACGVFLATKLLKTFLTPRPTPQLVEAFAARIRHHKYQMQPVLRELFESEAFFAAESRRAIIKSPIEVLMGTLALLETRPHFKNCIDALASLGHDLFEPPTVKGWEGGSLWINSASMIARMNLISECVTGARFGRAEDAVIHSLLARKEAAKAMLPASFSRLNPGRRDELLGVLLDPEYQML